MSVTFFHIFLSLIRVLHLFSPSHLHFAVLMGFFSHLTIENENKTLLKQWDIAIFFCVKIVRQILIFIRCAYILLHKINYFSRHDLEVITQKNKDLEQST